MSDTDIYIPESELRKAYDLGSEAAKQKKSADSCPFTLPAMRNSWEAGFEAMAEWLGDGQ